MASVSLRTVTKIFDQKVVAVNQFDLEVDDREFVVLVGPSGCGKSTVLRLIAGLEELTEGEIYIDDRLVNDVPPPDRDIAMVFQNYALYPHMTVYDNMTFGLRMRRYPKDEIEQRVREAAAILGIEDLLDRKPRALSGGQRQRVAVGRAIVRKPKVFLFDEPLSNLDAKLRVQMRAEISRIHQRLKATIIYVTHDQTEAMTMGDRIVVLKDGEIQQVAQPLELYDNPTSTFVAGFIGSPPMNFFEGEVVEAHFRSKHFDYPLPDEMLSGIDLSGLGTAILGVRPEAIHVVSGASGDEGLKVSGQVEVVEPMGSEIFLHVRIGQILTVARVPPGGQYKVGQEIKLKFDERKLHLFRGDTGKRLV
jgi:multiple sugar transport system ATP-binding protein